MRLSRPCPPGVSVLMGLLVVMGVSCPAWALKPVLVDGGDLFKPPTVEKVNAEIQQIKQKFGMDLMIEVYAKIPSDLRATYEQEGKEAFYRNWLARRARALGVHGIFVLITAEPGRVQIGMDAATRKQLFTASDREALQKVMTGAFREKQFDRGLLEGIALVRDHMEKNNAGQSGETARPPATSSAPTATVPGSPSAPPTTQPMPGPSTQPAGQADGGEF